MEARRLLRVGKAGAEKEGESGRSRWDGRVQAEGAVTPCVVFLVLFSSFPPENSVLVVAVSVIHIKISRVITGMSVCSRLGCSQYFNYVIRHSPISFSWRLLAAFGRRAPGTPGSSAVLGASRGDATRSSWRPGARAGALGVFQPYCLFVACVPAESSRCN